MPDPVLLVVVAVAAFLATNMDNVALLIGLLARYSERTGLVAAGYLAAMAAIVGIAMAVGKLADLVSVEYLGYFGIVPVGLGLKGCVDLVRGVEGGNNASGRSQGSAVAVVAFATQLGNGSDTILTFSALFADSGELGDVVIGVVFLCMALVTIMAALRIAGNAWLLRRVERFGRYVTPFILIAIGLFILANTGMDVMPDA